MVSHRPDWPKGSPSVLAYAPADVGRPEVRAAYAGLQLRWACAAFGLLVAAALLSLGGPQPPLAVVKIVGGFVAFCGVVFAGRGIVVALLADGGRTHARLVGLALLLPTLAFLLAFTSTGWRLGHATAAPLLQRAVDTGQPETGFYGLVHVQTAWRDDAGATWFQTGSRHFFVNNRLLNASRHGFVHDPNRTARHAAVDLTLTPLGGDWFAYDLIEPF